MKNIKKVVALFGAAFMAVQPVTTFAEGINTSADAVEKETEKPIGTLRIIARHDDNKNFIDGHSFVLFTSYVDGFKVDVNNDEIYNYYTFNKDKYGDAVKNDENLLSWKTTEGVTQEEVAAEKPFTSSDKIRTDAADEMYKINYTLGTETATPNKEAHLVLNRGDYITIGDYVMGIVDKTKLIPVHDSSSSVTPDSSSSVTPDSNSSVTPDSSSIVTPDSDIEAGTLDEIELIKKLYEEASGDKDASIAFLKEHAGPVASLIGQESGIPTADAIKDLLQGKADGGIWINRELYCQKQAFSQSPNAVYEVEITQKQYDDMMSSLKNESYYNPFNHNCSTVSTKAWDTAAGYQRDTNGDLIKDAKGNYVPGALYISARNGQSVSGKVDTPMEVKHEILSLNQKKLAGENIPGKFIGENVPVIRGTDVAAIVDPGKTDDTKKDEPAIDPGKTDDTKKDESAIDPGKTDDTKKDEPAVDPGKTDDTKKDEPAVDPGKTDDTKKDEPAVDPGKTDTDVKSGDTNTGSKVPSITNYIPEDVIIAPATIEKIDNAIASAIGTVTPDNSTDSSSAGAARNAFIRRTALRRRVSGADTKVANDNGTQTIKDDKTPLSASKKSAKSSDKNKDVSKDEKAEESYDRVWILVVISACALIAGCIVYKKKKSHEAE